MAPQTPLAGHNAACRLRVRYCWSKEYWKLAFEDGFSGKHISPISDYFLVL